MKIICASFRYCARENHNYIMCKAEKVLLTSRFRSRYDQTLFEDENKNRMMETKELFEWVLKQPCFEVSSSINI